MLKLLGIFFIIENVRVYLNGDFVFYVIGYVKLNENGILVG